MFMENSSKNETGQKPTGTRATDIINSGLRQMAILTKHFKPLKVQCLAHSTMTR